jgi:phosphoribosyl 1,2-cyclic phosphodiesterase
VEEIAHNLSEDFPSARIAAILLTHSHMNDFGGTPVCAVVSDARSSEAETERS